MGRLVVTEFMTLDGVAQAPGGHDEDRDDGFSYGGWQAPLLNQEAGQAVFEQAKTMDALLLGRKTYEVFANYWPTVPQEVPFAAPDFIEHLLPLGLRIDTDFHIGRLERGCARASGSHRSGRRAKRSCKAQRRARLTEPVRKSFRSRVTSSAADFTYRYPMSFTRNARSVPAQIFKELPTRSITSPAMLSMRSMRSM